MPKCSGIHINQKTPKETTSTFRFPQVLRNKMRHKLYTYIYIYTIFDCCFPCAPRQPIHCNNKPSLYELLQWVNPPELCKQFEAWTHIQDLVKRRWGKGETCCETFEGGAMKGVIVVIYDQKSWGIFDFTLGVGQHVKKQKFVLFETLEFENYWQGSCLETSEFFPGV